ncbi:helix-turn-helix domain-containing protein [Streptomyces sp. NPDC004376]
MPRWKPLPDELDPQIREFTGQLRRIVDQGGLSVAALADRTGYSRTSWERYLGGRLLAPLGAVVALAEATGTSPVHLTTMWELAERAWSRAESRQDRTMEAIRITQARAALGDAGAAGVGGAGAGAAVGGGDGAGGAGAAAGAGAGAGAPGHVPGPGDTVADAVQAPSGAGFGAAPAVGGAGTGGPPPPGGFGPAPAPGRTGGGNGAAPRTPDGTGAPENPGGTDHGGAAPGIAGPAGVVPVGAPHIPAQPTAADVDRAAPPAGDTGRARRTTLFAAGAAVVLVAIGAVLLFTGRDDGGGEPERAVNSPSARARTPQALPSGVKCAGASCAGKDAEAMGCSGARAATVSSAVAGTVTLEVRYSRICGAAWGRITGAAPGDRVRVLAGGERPGAVTETGDTLAYTPMVTVEKASGVRACATLAGGRTACTKPAK